MEPSATNLHSRRPRRSRLRIVCPAYPAFNIYSAVAKRMTALGPVCIATAVNDIPDWDAEVIDENNYQRGQTDANGKPDHAACQQARPADVVGLYGGLTSTIPRLYEIARQYKALGARVIAGGNHFADDNIAEALHNGVDVVVIGEGERTITELLACFDAGGDLAEIDGVAFLRDGAVVRTPRREPITDFDELPIPDFSVLRNARLEYFPISGVRGCAMNCEFCTVKGKPRFGTPERMMEQFASIHENYGGWVFFIVDDLFGQNRADALRLCRMLADYQKQRRVKFTITVQIRLDRADDTELLQAMRLARINTLAIGFESPIAEELKAMNKRLAPEDMIELARKYHRAGFRIHGMFIFGYPTPADGTFRMGPAERVKRFNRFIRRARLDTVQVLLPIPLPGTEMTRRLLNADRVFPTETVGLEYYDGNFTLFEPDAPMTSAQLQASIHQIMRRFYGVRHFAALALNVMAFPSAALWLHGARNGMQRWQSKWIRDLTRCGGWVLLRKWTAAFRKNDFLSKLAAAQRSRTARALSRGS